jgi:hypothetical protein
MPFSFNKAAGGRNFPSFFFFPILPFLIIDMTEKETSLHEKFVVLVIAGILITLFIKIIFF